MPSPAQPEPSESIVPASIFAVRPGDPENDRYPDGRPSVGKRALIALIRFLIIFCIGASATLAWQSYGDSVREMIASSYPQRSWSASRAEPVPQNARDVIGLASRTASSPDQQQPNSMSLDLGVVREVIDPIATRIAFSQEQMTSSADRIATSQEQIAHSVERIATSQEEVMRSVEQIMRSVDQFTANQEQMTREVTKLQAIEQSIRSKSSEPSPPPASASASTLKPVSRPASASKPVSPEPTRP